MQRLLTVWDGIDGRKRITLGLAAMAVLVSFVSLSRLATSPSMALLYSGLEATSAGEVVKALEQQGVAFEIRNNAIMVDAGRRDELRMLLAADGLPANNGKGYELLDGLSGFGTTAQMFDAAYWRAKEGELARTIVANPLFSMARVHISNTTTSPFRGTSSQTASVTVTSSSGVISGAQAKAFKYLVASAVSGMTPGDVAVIDGRSGVVVSGDRDAGNVVGADNRANTLKANVERLLEARVGRGNAIVEVNVETTTEQETIFERKLDPESRVAISSLKEERTKTSTNAQNGAVTVASNLPAGNASGGDNNSSSKDNETSETLNYEVSESTRELSRLPGAIRRVSVAVLVNDLRETDPETNNPIWRPRDPAEMVALRELVESAIGYDEARGDSVTLKSLRFETPKSEGTVVSASFFQGLMLDTMRLIQLAVLALVSLMLGLFVVRPILMSGPTPALPIPTPADKHLRPAAIANEVGGTAQPLTGEIDVGPIDANTISLVTGEQATEAKDTVETNPSTDPVKRLRDMISDKQGETVEILREWIDDEEERV